MKKVDHYNFLLQIKMSATTYYQNRNVILNKAKGYYKNEKKND